MPRWSRRARLAVARKEVIFVPTETLTRDEHRVVEERPLVARPTWLDELRMAARRYAARVRRLKLTPAVWGVWTILITTLWVALGVVRARMWRRGSWRRCRPDPTGVCERTGEADQDAAEQTRALERAVDAGWTSARRSAKPHSDTVSRPHRRASLRAVDAPWTLGPEAVATRPKRRA